MRRWVVVLLMIVILVAPGMIAADWSASDSNLTMYQERYAEESASYKRVRYGTESDAVQRIKQQLHELGYFDNRINTSYFRTLEIAARVFCQQMRIGGDGREITPLMQAMLADPARIPQAVSPGINVYDYSRTGDETQYLPYTYAQLQRANVAKQASVGFSGRVAYVANEGSLQYIALIMEESADGMVYLVYQPLPRTTRFQAGDRVAVFGVTQGLQSLPYEGMFDERLTVQADRVGYAK